MNPCFGLRLQESQQAISSEKRRAQAHTVDPVLGRLEVVGSPVLGADNRGHLRRLRIQEDPLRGLCNSIPRALKTRFIVGEQCKEEKKGPRAEHEGHGGGERDEGCWIRR